MPQKPTVDRTAGRWWGQTVCVIASGPSLTEADCDVIAGTDWPTIVINNSWRLARFADVLYACDEAWWKVHFAQVTQEFAGERWTQDFNAANRFGLHRVGSRNSPGLGKDGIIHQGGNSGYQAINLAWLWGASRVLLLGLDCKSGANQKAHWFGQHEGPLSRHQNYPLWLEHFPRLAEDLAAEGVEVFNLSPDTALTCFPRITLDEAMARFSE